MLNDKQKEFIEFVLSKYIETGVSELDQDKLPILLTNKYQSLEDAKEILGSVAKISSLFIEFQKYLYQKEVAWNWEVFLEEIGLNTQLHSRAIRENERAWHAGRYG